MGMLLVTRGRGKVGHVFASVSSYLRRDPDHQVIVRVYVAPSQNIILFFWGNSTGRAATLQEHETH